MMYMRDLYLCTCLYTSEERETEKGEPRHLGSNPATYIHCDKVDKRCNTTGEGLGEVRLKNMRRMIRAKLKAKGGHHSTPSNT